jgi:pyridinium-3,5-bisthiocarboxylic acid mononucleotide nickel chelatase
MNVLIVDPFGGISGDMLLGSLVHLGCPTGYLEEVFGKLNIGPFHMHTKADSIHGISCLGLTFDIPDSHEGRDYASIRDTILSRLPDPIRIRAEKIFKVLAHAEAQVHGVAVEDVHFHEIGALDSILDIVGISAALERLGIDAIYTNPVPLGGGMTNSLHGKIPVPAPATVKLLEGMKVRITDLEAELTTPTGAAVLKALAEKGDPPTGFVVRSVGYGCGSRRFEDWPNLCRTILGEVNQEKDNGVTYHIEADIDDMIPEDAVAALDYIMAAGARDAGIIPRIMKQGRPGFTMSALCDCTRLEGVLEAFLVHTSTIGVRYHAIDRMVLPRREYRIATRYGEIGIKEVTLPDGTLRFKPEYRDLQEISRTRGLTMAELRSELEWLIREERMKS